MNGEGPYKTGVRFREMAHIKAYAKKGGTTTPSSFQVYVFFDYYFDLRRRKYETKLCYGTRKYYG